MNNKKIKLIDKALIKSDFYTTAYFNKAINILNSANKNDTCIMQFKCFYDHEYMVSGIYECIEIIKTRLSKKDFNELEIYYFSDGTIIKPNQCVLSIRAKYQKIAMLENILDSILARRSSVATNCYYFLKYLKTDQIVYMADRGDDYHLMPFDGYSAYVAGIRNFSNIAHLALLNKNNYEQCKIFGSIPHALIQQFNGDIVATFKAYHNYSKQNITMLVDYDNDIIGSLKQLQPYLNKINAIRVDTSNDMIDASLKTTKTKDIKSLYGSNHKLFVLIRNWLNKNNASHIKIICSSNNQLDKIKTFKKLKTPVDFYGIGSALNKLSLHFTADLVMLNDLKQAKQGRHYIEIKGMKKYNNEKFSFKNKTEEY